MNAIQNKAMMLNGFQANLMPRSSKQKFPFAQVNNTVRDIDRKHMDS